MWPVPVDTFPSALVSPAEMFPELDLRSKVKSLISLVKSKSIDPERVWNDESSVIVFSVPRKSPELERSSNVPAEFKVSILPEDELNSLMPSLESTTMLPELLDTNISPPESERFALPEDVLRFSESENIPEIAIEPELVLMSSPVSTGALMRMTDAVDCERLISNFGFSTRTITSAPFFS